jgi:hypothetical protein
MDACQPEPWQAAGLSQDNVRQFVNLINSPEKRHKLDLRVENSDPGVAATA